jgi:hypothetical protein
VDELRRARRAAARLDRDRRRAFGTVLGVRVLLRAARHEVVDGRHNEEEDDCGDREERDQVVEEVPIEEVARVDRERQRAEVGLAEDQRDDRREDVGDGRRLAASDDGQAPVMEP